MKYSKVHTCDFADERSVESGKEFKVCDFEGIQLGIMICYDREYPKSARILMLKGAEVMYGCGNGILMDQILFSLAILVLVLNFSLENLALQIKIKVFYIK